MLSLFKVADNKQIRRPFILAVALPTIISLCIAALFLWQVTSLREATKGEYHTEQVISQANLVLRLIIDEQVGIRGFLLNNSDVYLKPYYNSKTQLPKEIKTLYNLVGDNESQKEILNQINSLSLEYLEMSEGIIKEKKGNINFRVHAPVGKGNFETSLVRNYFDRFIDSEKVLRTRRTNTLAVKTHLAIMIGISLSVLLGLVLSLFTGRTLVFLTNIYGNIIKKAEKAADDLARALTSRDEFLSIASHELKTPLTSLKLRLDLTNRSINPALNLSPTLTKLKKDLSMCCTQTEKLTSLIDELLDVSRIQSGKIRFNFQKVNLSELTKETIEFYQDQFKESGCAITVDIRENIYVTCDAFRIDQVLVNLISNAVKYGANKPVHISLTEEAQFIKLAVNDHGIGIDKNAQMHIFERYERAENTSVISGLGLGLYITKQIVNAHSGDITVHSDLGKGSTFTVTLPIKSDLKQFSRLQGELT